MGLLFTISFKYNDIKQANWIVCLVLELVKLTFNCKTQISSEVDSVGEEPDSSVDITLWRDIIIKYSTLVSIDMHDF